MAAEAIMLSDIELLRPPENPRKRKKNTEERKKSLFTMVEIERWQQQQHQQHQQNKLTVSNAKITSTAQRSESFFTDNLQQR